MVRIYSIDFCYTCFSNYVVNKDKILSPTIGEGMDLGEGQRRLFTPLEKKSV